MASKYGLWVVPKTGERRVYINGIGDREEKIYAVADTAAAGGFRIVVQSAGRCSHYRIVDLQRMGREAIGGLDWSALLRECSPHEAEEEKTPQSPPADSMKGWLSAFESSLIIHLATAARMAGLQFRNGLKKSEIIDRLRVQPRVAEATHAALLKLQSGQTPTPVPAGDDNPFAEALKDAPLATPVSVDLQDYVKRPELTEALQPITGSLALAKHRIATLESQVKELSERRPVELHLPELPAPVQFEGVAHPKMPLLVKALRAKSNVMLKGPAGSGKTYATEQVAESLGLKYHKQPPVNYTHEVLGHFDANGKYQRTATREAVEFGGVLNLDEFDACSADAGLAFNQVADGSTFVAFPDGLVRKHPGFVIVANVNTDGSGATMQFSGRTRLDGATLNRFAIIEWGYDSALEDLTGQTCPEWVSAVRAVRAFAESRGILDVVATMRDIVRGVALFNGGCTRSEVLELTQKRGALVECWSEVLRLPPVDRFIKGA